jgi:hypothetical protein
MPGTAWMAQRLHKTRQLKQRRPRFHLNPKENKMKLICTLQAIEEHFSAAAFAEENEHQTARELLRRQEDERKAQHRPAAVNTEKLGVLTTAT